MIVYGLPNRLYVSFYVYLFHYHVSSFFWCGMLFRARLIIQQLLAVGFFCSLLSTHYVVINSSLLIYSPLVSTTRIVLIHDSFFVIVFFHHKLPKPDRVLLKPKLGPRFCDKIHGPSLLTSKIRQDASLPHLMPLWPWSHLLVFSVIKKIVQH